MLSNQCRHCISAFVLVSPYIHCCLRQAAGDKLNDLCRHCIAAFVDTMLQGGTKPGVWFPEEPGAVNDRMRLLEQSAQGCIRFELNQPPWRIESDAKQMGMGFYW